MENTSLISSRAERVLAASAILAASIGLGVLFTFDPTKVSILPPCPLITITGFACPGCGMTRGMHALLHGDFITALDFNALLPLWLLIFGYLGASIFSVAVRGKSLPLKIFSPIFLSSMLVLLIAFGVLRNIPIYPLSILYP